MRSKGLKRNLGFSGKQVADNEFLKTVKLLSLWLFDKEFKRLKTHAYPTLAQSKYFILEKHVLRTTPKIFECTQCLSQK